MLDAVANAVAEVGGSTETGDIGSGLAFEFGGLSKHVGDADFL